MEQKLPKTLVVAINAWREDATSHTLKNIFSCWEPEKLSLVYTRADLPDTAVCSRFFQISENDVLKSVFKPWRQTGREVFNTPVVDETLIEEEHQRYAKARKKHSYFLTICREGVWLLGHWRSKELKRFLCEVEPELLFIPIYPTVYMGWVQRYIIRQTKKPFVCYLADDNHSYAGCKGILSYIHRFFLRRQVRYLATHCREMFVIVDKEKEETDRLFGTDSVILTKGIDFSGPAPQRHAPQRPLKLVYTGNLIIGRDKTLADVADIINEINEREGEIKATLDVYSPDQVDEATMSRLNRLASKHNGFIARDKVASVQQAADVVIFAEALEGKDSLAARLSFSTKITDYLANAKCILAIGRRDIAPIEYFLKNDAALVASNKVELSRTIERLIDDPSIIHEYEEKAFACGKKNHEQSMVNQTFIDTLCRAAETRDTDER